MSELLADVRLSCGRHYLQVAGFVLAMEGDPCREAQLPEEVYPEIPEEELAHATIGDKPANELPRDIVRFFRGVRWTPEMLRYVADVINKRCQD